MSKRFSYSVENISNQEIRLRVEASHYFEPVAKFLILTNNSRSEIKCSEVGAGICNTGFSEGVKLDSGLEVNAFVLGSMNSITPKIPLNISVKWTEGVEPSLLGLMHLVEENRWKTLPVKGSSQNSQTA
ncbi:MAG: hypothetical protein GKR99_20355 [Rhodobacteraceae bacterium]|nr:hypothetical protein [Paracoccaceae bacterium]